MTTSVFKIFIVAALLVAGGVAVPACAQNAETAIVADDAVVPSSAEQVLVTANVVTIALNAEHRDGVDWSAIVADFHSVALKREDNPVWADKKFKLSVGVVSLEDYAVLLEALDTVGQMKQAPHPAFQLELNENKNEVLNDAINLSLQMTRQRGEEAVISVEPHLSLAKMSLKAKTELPLKDKTTIVIGGIFSEEEITKTHKFPLLGDLPLVGLVFRSRGHLIKRTETVIFLTISANTIPDVEENADKANADN